MTAAPASHYERIGGPAAVTTAVDRLYERLLADPDLKHYFAGVSMPHLKRHFVYQVIKVLGGPDHYQGRSLKDAHAGLHVTEAAYERVGGHLVAVLAGLGVPDDIIRDVGVVLTQVGPEIVAPTHHSWLWRVMHPEAAQ
jgi:hemoglobin